MKNYKKTQTKKEIKYKKSKIVTDLSKHTKQ